MSFLTSEMENGENMKHYMYHSKVQYIARRAVKVIPGIINRFIKVGVFAFDLIPTYFKRNNYVYSDGDFVRNSTLELISREIYEQQIPGSVAELGVFRGDFAKLINQAFPDKKLFLFDTFEGFIKKDIQGDDAEGDAADEEQFSDTSVDLVLSKMRYPENCVVKKGYFPDTFFGVDEQFSFVSIDFDLYQPIYSGLCVIWKALSPGGFIMIHDYQNKMFPGSKRAVRQFCEEESIQLMPLSDTCGSAVIMKNIRKEFV